MVQSSDLYKMINDFPLYPFQVLQENSMKPTITDLPNVNELSIYLCFHIYHTSDHLQTISFEIDQAVLDEFVWVINGSNYWEWQEKDCLYL